MSDFHIEKNKIQQKLFYILNHSEEARDCFSKYYFNELITVTQQMIDCYDERIAQAERKILELEKELTFCGMPASYQQVDSILPSPSE